MTTTAHTPSLLKNGFTIAGAIYTEQEVANLLSVIEATETTKPAFRKTAGLFAIRQFLKEVPRAAAIIFNHQLLHLISEVFGRGYFVVKSIYFDKPEASNWFVAYHQDLTISVDKKTELEGFTSWTVKQNQYTVQPPLSVLENNFTLRIHLDHTDENNGALKVIAGSHAKGIRRIETIDRNTEKEVMCNVEQGGVMIMKPLLFHASGRTVNHQKRRVLHIEFSNQPLPEGLEWAERFDLKHG